MEFKDLEKRVLKNAEEYGKKHEISIDLDFVSLKLAEEVGEFYQALLIHLNKCRKEKRKTHTESKEELAREMADVVGLAMLVSSVLGINLEEAMIEKWSHHLEEKRPT